MFHGVSFDILLLLKRKKSEAKTAKFFASVFNNKRIENGSGKTSDR